MLLHVGFGIVSDAKIIEVEKDVRVTEFSGIYSTLVFEAQKERFRQGPSVFKERFAEVLEEGTFFLKLSLPVF